MELLLILLILTLGIACILGYIVMVMEVWVKDKLSGHLVRIDLSNIQIKGKRIIINLKR